MPGQPELSRSFLETGPREVVELFDELDSAFGGSGLESAGCDALREVAISYDVKKVNLREFRYSGAIVSLYGTWENFVRKVWLDYFVACRKHECFKVSSKYIDRIFDYVLRQRTDWKSENNPDYIKLLQMVSDISSGVSYSINADIFFKNFPNYRIDTVCEIFLFAEVNGIKDALVQNRNFASVVNLRHPDYELIDDKEKKMGIAFETLSDLVLRRNNIAHGLDRESFLSSAEIIGVIAYLQALADAMCGVLVEHIVAHNFDLYQDLKLLIHISSTVGVFYVSSFVSVGTKLAVKDGSGKIRELVILEMRDSNKITISSIAAGCVVSLKLNGSFDQPWQFKAIPDSI
jgi:hypothetical protein